MCTLNYWASSQHGFVATCSRCKRVHLAFGTCMLLLSAAQFETMMRHTAELLASTDLPANEHTKIACIPTGTEQAFLAVSFAEAKHLFQLLDRAHTAITTQQLLDLFTHSAEE